MAHGLCGLLFAVTAADPLTLLNMPKVPACGCGFRLSAGATYLVHRLRSSLTYSKAPLAGARGQTEMV